MWPIINQFGNAAGAVKRYVGNVAREVRDVPTAYGTNVKVGTEGGAGAMQNRPLDVASGRNLAKQVKEVGGSFLGKSGTRSDQYSKSTGYVSGSKLSSPSSSVGMTPKSSGRIND